MKKRLLLVFAGFACVLIAGYFLHAWLTKTHINRETFERIENGMTLAEVEQIIGVPPGNYETRQRNGPRHPRSAYVLFEGNNIYSIAPEVTWSSNDGEIIVTVSKDGRVMHKHFNDVELESVSDTLRRWLGFAPEPDAVWVTSDGSPIK